MKTAIKTAKLEITAIGAGGDGLAVFEGKPAYTPKTAPGDVVEAALSGERGTVKNILTPSPARIDPPCPHYARCGGCALQHVNEEFYRDWKIKKIQAALARENVKHDAWNDPVFLPAATRRRVTMAAAHKGGRITLGYNEARSHSLIDIRTCLILDPVLAASVQALRQFLPRILPEGKTCDITLQYADGFLDAVLTGPLQTKERFTLEQDEAFGEMMEVFGLARLSWRKKDFGAIEPILSRRPVLKKFGALTVSLPPATFLQASDTGETALTKIVREHTNGAANIADLFCGAGTFTGHMLASGASVTALDGDAPAIEALAATKHPKLTAQRRDLFKNPLTEMELKPFEAVVFDPPRAGASAQAERLAWSGVQKIVGISCNPASFARDAAVLLGGGYKLRSLTLIDQFVWSSHVEIAGVFTKA